MSERVRAQKQPQSRVAALLRKAREEGVNVLNAARSVRSSIREIPEQVRNLRRDGFINATRNNARAAVQSARNPTTPLGKHHALRTYGIVTDAIALPGKIGGAARDVRNAWRNPNRENVTKATDSGIGAARTTISVASDGLQTARDVQRYGVAYRAARQSVAQSAPTLSPAVQRAASRAAARSAFSGANVAATRSATRTAVQNTLRRAGASAGDVAGGVSRTAGRRIVGRVAPQAARAAVPAVARAASGPIARAAGRFVPGANVAIAGLDVAQFANDMRNPRVGTARRIASGITALGSVAAASNIPVVSQVGAGVSTVSSLVRGWLN